jgi:hypothetical protein
MHFDQVLIADWLAASRPTSAMRRTIAIGISKASGTGQPFRARFGAQAWLLHRLGELSGRGVPLGFDFAIAFPAGFARTRMRLLAWALVILDRQGRLSARLGDAPAPARQGGWILGTGHAELLQAAAGHHAD